MQAKENLILVGMMGAGKTTAGRLLARKLKRPFYDSDEEIERRCGVGIPVIFDVEGEPGFRQRESQALSDLCAQSRIVLATGGGAVLSEENRRCLANHGTVVYLHAQPAQLWLRVRNDRNRPLLATPDPERTLEDLYRQRDPLYREIADVVMDTGRQSVQTLVKDLLVRLEELPCRLSA